MKMNELYACLRQDPGTIKDPTYDECVDDEGYVNKYNDDGPVDERLKNENPLDDEDGNPFGNDNDENPFDDGYDDTLSNAVNDNNRKPPNDDTGYNNNNDHDCDDGGHNNTNGHDDYYNNGYDNNYDSYDDNYDDNYSYNNDGLYNDDGYHNNSHHNNADVAIAIDKIEEEFKHDLLLLWETFSSLTTNHTFVVPNLSNWYVPQPPISHSNWLILLGGSTLHLWVE